MLAAQVRGTLSGRRQSDAAFPGVAEALTLKDDCQELLEEHSVGFVARQQHDRFELRLASGSAPSAVQPSGVSNISIPDIYDFLPAARDCINLLRSLSVECLKVTSTDQRFFCASNSTCDEPIHVSDFSQYKQLTSQYCRLELYGRL